MAVMDDTRDELQALRAQVHQLMEDRVNPAFADFSKRAGKAARQARAAGDEYAEAATAQVRAQPLLAVGAATVLGFVLGRLTK